MTRNPNANFAGKVAFVTGAASGIGRAAALAFAREGAAVVAADVSEPGNQETARRIEGLGGRALAVRCDVARAEEVKAALAKAVETFGRLDLAFNNAGIEPRKPAPTADYDEDEWERILDINLRGVFLCMKHEIPLILKHGGGGAIVNTSSASGLVGDPVRTAYGVSKAGLDSLTRYVATQYGKRGIRCNSIAPGVIATPALAANVPPEMIAIYERSHLTPRLGRPEDIAAAVVFLASGDAAFITGQTLSVDGGLLAHHPAFGELLLAAGGGR